METTQRVETTFLPTYRERLRAELSLLGRAPVTLLASAAFPAAGIWLLWLLLKHPQTASASSFVTVFACFCFTPFFFFWNSYRAHRISKKSGPFTYVFDSAGVHVSTSLAQSTQLWPGILRIRASDRLLFVHFSKRCAHFVPVHALPAPDSVKIIRQLAHAGGVSRVGT